MHSRLFHHITYIDWFKESKREVLTQEEFASKIREVVNMPGMQRAASKTKREDFYGQKFFVSKDGNFKKLFVALDGKYFMYTTNEFDDNKNGEQGGVGSKAIRAFSEKFRQDNGLGLRALATAFGTTEAEFKDCIPKQFYFTDNKYLHRIITSASSIDATAHYPSSACGKLPDANMSITLPGTVAPDEQYPFAFYMKSGHCAEYGRFDTHSWLGTPLMLYLFDKKKLVNLCKFNPEEDVTVLMRASNFTFDEQWKYWYNKRKTDKLAKTIMNAVIGYFHTRKYNRYKYAHLAAIILGRANQKQLDMIEKIGLNNVMHACVDGIIYKGNKKYGIDEKMMGSYHQEFTDCKIKIRQMNCYIVTDQSGKLVAKKHGAFNKMLDGTDIKEDEFTSFDEIYEWKRENFIEIAEGENNVQVNN